ncbi:MAG: hypothetical protein EB059_08185 [Alphaproteobacteria bacterium]|nr:hypothetical protein [Alphaproteobacteria bacterium]
MQRIITAFINGTFASFSQENGEGSGTPTVVIQFQSARNVFTFPASGIDLKLLNTAKVGDPIFVQTEQGIPTRAILNHELLFTPIAQPT